MRDLLLAALRFGDLQVAQFLLTFFSNKELEEDGVLKGWLQKYPELKVNWPLPSAEEQASPAVYLDNAIKQRLVGAIVKGDSDTVFAILLNKNLDDDCLLEMIDIAVDNGQAEVAQVLTYSMTKDLLDFLIAKNKPYHIKPLIQQIEEKFQTQAGEVVDGLVGQLQLSRMTDLAEFAIKYRCAHIARYYISQIVMNNGALLLLFGLEETAEKNNDNPIYPALQWVIDLYLEILAVRHWKDIFIKCHERNINPLLRKILLLLPKSKLNEILKEINSDIREKIFAIEMSLGVEKVLRNNVNIIQETGEVRENQILIIKNAFGKLEDSFYCQSVAIDALWTTYFDFVCNDRNEKSSVDLLNLIEELVKKIEDLDISRKNFQLLALCKLVSGEYGEALDLYNGLVYERMLEKKNILAADPLTLPLFSAKILARLPSTAAPSYIKKFLYKVLQDGIYSNFIFPLLQWFVSEESFIARVLKCAPPWVDILVKRNDALKDILLINKDEILCKRELDCLNLISNYLIKLSGNYSRKQEATVDDLDEMEILFNISIKFQDMISSMEDIYYADDPDYRNELMGKRKALRGELLSMLRLIDKNSKCVEAEVVEEVLEQVPNSSIKRGEIKTLPANHWQTFGNLNKSNVSNGFLLSTIKNKDVVSFKRIIKYVDLDIFNSCDDIGSTIAHYIAGMGNKEIMAAFVAVLKPAVVKALMSKLNDHYQTPMEIAVESNNREVVDYLFENKLGIFYSDLHEQIYLKKPITDSFLKDLITARDNAGALPLEYAVSSGNIDKVKFLLDYTPLSEVNMANLFKRSINAKHSVFMRMFFSKLTFEEFQRNVLCMLGLINDIFSEPGSIILKLLNSLNHENEKACRQILLSSAFDNNFLAIYQILKDDNKEEAKQVAGEAVRLATGFTSISDPLARLSEIIKPCHNGKMYDQDELRKFIKDNVPRNHRIVIENLRALLHIECNKISPNNKVMDCLFEVIKALLSCDPNILLPVDNLFLTNSAFMLGSYSSANNFLHSNPCCKAFVLATSNEVVTMAPEFMLTAIEFALLADFKEAMPKAVARYYAKNFSKLSNQCLVAEAVLPFIESQYFGVNELAAIHNRLLKIKECYKYFPVRAKESTNYNIEFRRFRAKRLGNGTGFLVRTIINWESYFLAEEVKSLALKPQKDDFIKRHLDKIKKANFYCLIAHEIIQMLKVNVQKFNLETKDRLILLDDSAFNTAEFIDGIKNIQKPLADHLIKFEYGHNPVDAVESPKPKRKRKNNNKKIELKKNKASESSSDDEEIIVQQDEVYQLSPVGTSTQSTLFFKQRFIKPKIEVVVASKPVSSRARKEPKSIVSSTPPKKLSPPPRSEIAPAKNSPQLKQHNPEVKGGSTTAVISSLPPSTLSPASVSVAPISPQSITPVINSGLLLPVIPPFHQIPRVIFDLLLMFDNRQWYFNVRSFTLPNSIPVSAVLFGGIVRDCLLGKGRFNDADIFTTMSVEDLERLLPTIADGGQVGLRGRKEKDKDGFWKCSFRMRFKGIEVDIVPLEPDQLIPKLKSVDFPMNAMAYHPFVSLIDPELRGSFDIKDRVINFLRPGDSFERHPDLLLRAFRFRILTNFDLCNQMEAELNALVKSNHIGNLIYSVPIEKCRSEYQKLIDVMGREAAHQLLKHYRLYDTFVRLQLIQLEENKLSTLLTAHSSSLSPEF